LFFFLLLPSALLPVYGYLAWRLANGPWALAALGLPFLAVLAFPFLVSRRSADGGAGGGARAAARAAYLSMGVVSFLLVASLARDAAGLLSGHWLPRAAAVELAAAMLLAASAFGGFGPRVKRVKVRLPGLPAALVGLRIAQISDLHLSQHIGLRYVRRAVRKAAGLRADLLAFTGDIGDGPVGCLRAEIEALRPLTGAVPAFYVPGNHEVYWNFTSWLDAFRGLGMRVLLNEGERVRLRGEDVFVAGITDPACEALGLAPDLGGAARGAEGAALRILLSHRPDPAERAAEAGFELQLSGHTHGGQFFPWTLVAGLVHRYSLGLYRIGRMAVYVSAGTGSWGPRLRLGTRAEVTLLELEG
jgi:predicted MPP superfamily phosphohydrolase